MQNLIPRLSIVPIVFLTVLLSSCATKPLQVPYDANATFFSAKTKINAD